MFVSLAFSCCFFSRSPTFFIRRRHSAELAANFLEKKDGPGMFKVRLIDAIYHVTTKWNLVNLKPEEKVS